MPTPPSPALHQLTLTRVLDATPEKVFRAWTEPALLRQWFAPLPVITTQVELDVRPGGSTFIVMRMADGTEIPCHGIYLEVVPGRRLVSTDAYVSAWIPSGKPFMTLDLTFEPFETGKTLYTATVLHWSGEDRLSHEKMGFHEGWGQATDQLAALVAKL
jgi:uncharacterized protein YndB with AHSA1/START domain